MDRPVLSRRQRQVLQLAADGCTRRETAKRLFVQETTAKKHLNKARAVLGARSTTEAVAIALRLGLIR